MPAKLTYHLEAEPGGPAVAPARRSVRIPDGTNILAGRLANCDIVLPGSRVANAHVALSFDPTASVLRIEDLNSVVGTVVDGSVCPPGVPRTVPTGSRAVLGDVILVVDAVETAPPDVPPAGPSGPGDPLAPLRPLLDNPAVREVIVYGPSAIYRVTESGTEKVPAGFHGVEEVYRALDSLLRQATRTNAPSPFIHATLPNNRVLNAVIPASTSVSPTLVIARRDSVPTLPQMVAAGTCDPQVAALLRLAIAARRNVFVTGAGRAARASFMAILARLLPTEDRIVLIEEVPAIEFEHPTVARLRATGPDFNSSMAHLASHALRLRPDRLIISDLWPSAAAELLEALAGDSRGSLAGVEGGDIHAGASRLLGFANAPGATSGGMALLVGIHALPTLHVSGVVEFHALGDGLRAAMPGRDFPWHACEVVRAAREKGIPIPAELEKPT